MNNAENSFFDVNITNGFIIEPTDDFANQQSLSK